MTVTTNNKDVLPEYTSFCYSRTQTAQIATLLYHLDSKYVKKKKKCNPACYSQSCSNCVCRNFIWSMTSWRRGHMCQQHLITTQPSRPSKAQSVQWLQLFCTQHSHPGGGAVVHTIGFYSLRIWLFDCRGHCLHQYCPAFPKSTFCPKHQHLFYFYSLCSPCFV